MKEVKAIYKGELLEITDFKFTKGEIYRGFRDELGLLFLQDDYVIKYFGADCKLEKHETCYCIFDYEEKAFEFID